MATNEKTGAGRGAITAWSLYDFGNSAFATLVVTFIYAAFFTETFAPNPEVGTAWWSRAVTVTAIAVALLSPIMGAIADRGGWRKALCLAFTWICILATLGLYFIRPGVDTALLALVVFTIANIAFEMACVFYNAFLPDIATPAKIGRVSGYGWALGYVGGILALLAALFLFVKPEVPAFGFTTEGYQNVRATNLLVAAWFAVFSIPLFLAVREDRSRVSPPGTRMIRAGFRQLLDTFREIRNYRQIVRFLAARLIYNDGLVTIFAFGGIYAAGTFGFDTQKLIYFGILLNVTAALGAFALGFLDDRLGGKRTIMITLVALGMATAVALLAPNETVFWIAAAFLGIFVGPNQSASRSLMGRLVPPDKENEFFGFFAFSGKATAFLGPFLLGLITQASGSQRVGLGVVLLFFAIGAWILSGVDEEEGLTAAMRD